MSDFDKYMLELEKNAKSSSIAIKIFSLPRSSAWELGHQSGRKIAVDLFSVGRTDKVEAMAVSRKI